MGQRGQNVSNAGADTFEWLFEDGGDQASHNPDNSHPDATGPVVGEGGSEEWVELPGDDAFVCSFDEDHDEQKDKTEKEEQPTYSAHSYELKIENRMAMDLRCWLKDDGKSVFWVTGKPDSGKSTFMKFLRDHDGTDELLREWAQDEHLIVADHFFWLPGTQLQKTFEGLARSLMHAILSSLGADITSAKTVCGKRRWSLTASHRPWSQSEFKRMFSNLRGISGIRIFLLIDGLDECCPQHSHDDLMEMLMGIVQRPNFKACLSSRPWSEFATRLGRSPSLRPDQITQLDMITYVTNRIYPAARDQELTASEVHELVKLVVDRADGVFLWVELVVRAVSVELKKGRGLSRVSSIVQGLPTELEDYFTMLIYGRIDKTSGNISDTASVLSLAIQREEQHDLGYSSFQRYKFIDFWLLSRGALDIVMELPNTETSKYSRSQISVMREQTHSFLEVASKDLLVLIHNEVEFLHRTVFDFLRNGSVNDAIRQRSPAHFHKPGFISQVTALRCTYSLMCSQVSCGDVDSALRTIARLPCIDTTTRTFCDALATTCESLAMNHLQDRQSCFGQVNEEPDTLDNTTHDMRVWLGDFGHTSSDGQHAMPYRYTRAIFRYWPHTALTMLTGDFDCYATISDLKLRDLCSACTDIMHDCLYSGALPNDWIAQIEVLSREAYAPVMTSRQFVQSDDGPRYSTCEFCKVSLPYSKDCGLRDTFFLLEKIAFECRHVPTTDASALNPIDSPSLECKITNSLPFELPWSILRRTDRLHALSATSHFQQFVWNRQKLRAVRSLLTTVRRHLSGFATDKSSLCSGEMHEVWYSCIYQFIGPPTKRDSKGRAGFQPDCCSKQFWRKQRVVVFLQPNGFPLFCDKCYERAGPQTDSGPLFMFTVRLGYTIGIDRARLLETVGRTLVRAVLEIIAWYLATAPAYGLGWMVPSDIREIQRALLAIPDSTMNCDWQ
jgi:hypothetical protein